MARTGIRLRATAIATLVVAVALTAAAVVLVVLVHRSLLGSLDASGHARAQDVAALAQTGRLQGLVASTGEETSVVQVVVGGAVVAASPNIAGEPAMLATPPAGGRGQVATRDQLPIADSGQSFRVVAEPVALPSGPGWVYVANSLAQVNGSTHRLTLLLLIGMPVLLLVVAAATWHAVGRGLHPVERIRATAAAIGGGQPGARLPVPPSNDEIARLARTMNAMLARIDEAALRQRQFVGDASHELRSPLATVQTEIDVALAHPGQQRVPELLSRLAAQTARMAALLDDLLFLARADEQVPSSAHVPVDLDDLVLAEAHRLRDRGTAVRVDRLHAARVHGSPTDLARLLRNLGDNAARHTRTEVELGLHTDGTAAVVRVADDGPGIPAHDRERVFHRFTRLDAARTRPARNTAATTATTATTAGGTGLGLSIARQIALAHGGQLSLEDRDQAGALFVIRIPLARQDPAATSDLATPGCRR